MSTLKERSEARRRLIVTNRTTSHEEAEAWDLEFWQSRTADERLSAFVAILEDVSHVQDARDEHARKRLDR
jgi:hypothetical protein